MYLQITTVCNMSCAHCCMSCAADKRGEFMSIDTFNRALDVLGDDHVTIGGGEPTLHPKLFEMIGTVLCDREYLFMVINGKKTNIARTLHGLSKGNDRFDVELSQDEYHEPIDPAIVRLYTETDSIRTVTQISNTGHAVENGVGTTSECVCATLFVKPNGDIKTCACDDAITLCNVHDKNASDIIDNYNTMLCDIGESIDQCTTAMRDSLQELDQDEMDLCPETIEMIEFVLGKFDNIPVQLCA